VVDSVLRGEFVADHVHSLIVTLIFGLPIELFGCPSVVLSLDGLATFQLPGGASVWSEHFRPAQANPR
jgi:hypothetical protein